MRGVVERSSSARVGIVASAVVWAAAAVSALHRRRRRCWRWLPASHARYGVCATTYCSGAPPLPRPGPDAALSTRWVFSGGGGVFGAQRPPTPPLRPSATPGPGLLDRQCRRMNLRVAGAIQMGAVMVSRARS